MNKFKKFRYFLLEYKTTIDMHGHYCQNMFLDAMKMEREIPLKEFHDYYRISPIQVVNGTLPIDYLLEKAIKSPKIFYRQDRLDTEIVNERLGRLLDTELSFLKEPKSLEVIKSLDETLYALKNNLNILSYKKEKYYKDHKIKSGLGRLLIILEKPVSFPLTNRSIVDIKTTYKSNYCDETLLNKAIEVLEHQHLIKNFTDLLVKKKTIL